MCGRSNWIPVFNYDKPDKYEKWVGVESKRGWFRCGFCRFYQSWRDYDFTKLEAIYSDGYRSESFRGESIRESFEKVKSIPLSENSDRAAWFFRTARPNMNDSLLDVGSGFGIWPHHVAENGLDVSCVEVNADSLSWINLGLGLPCYPFIPKDKQYDHVSCIHTLEHIQDPEGFLGKLKGCLKDGYLFLEVPDAVEFDYMDKDHDEFNSCHLYFYDVPNLVRTVEFCGFRVTDIQRVYKNQRNLSRIRLLARG